MSGASHAKHKWFFILLISFNLCSIPVFWVMSGRYLKNKSSVKITTDSPVVYECLKYLVEDIDEIGLSLLSQDQTNQIGFVHKAQVSVSDVFFTLHTCNRNMPNSIQVTPPNSICSKKLEYKLRSYEGMVDLSASLLQILYQKYPKYKPQFAKNYEQFAARLNEVMDEIKNVSKPITHISFTELSTEHTGSLLIIGDQITDMLFSALPALDVVSVVIAPPRDSSDDDYQFYLSKTNNITNMINSGGLKCVINTTSYKLDFIYPLVKKQKIPYLTISQEPFSIVTRKPIFQKISSCLHLK